MVEISLLPHVFNHRMLGFRRIKDVFLRIGRIETTFPKTFEVYSVSQYQISICCNTIRGKKIPNVTFGHIADPIVNLITNSIWIGFEINFFQLIAK